jgi:hypothetical protein
MSDTSRKILGALTISPGLLSANEELTAGLFCGRERKLFEAIVSACAENEPETLDVAQLAGSVGGDNPITYVTGLLQPDELACVKPEAFRAMVAEIVGKRDNLSGVIRARVQYTTGDFTTGQLYAEFGATSVTEKDAIRQILHRMKEAGEITPTSKKDGIYRRVDKTLEEVDLLGVPPESLGLYLPIGMTEMVKIYRKSIIVVAGDTNQGKTACCHDFIKGNMKRHKVHLFFNEGGAEGLQDRLRKHEDLDISEWTLHAYERLDNFEDVIFANDINVVDYLTCPADHPWMIGPAIDAIYRKLEDGVCWINIQKGTGNELGRGADWGRERSQLYLTLSRDDRVSEPDPDVQYCVAKVLKAKAFIGGNPDGKALRFSIHRGWNIKHYNDWHYQPKAEPRQRRIWS